MPEKKITWEKVKGAAKAAPPYSMTVPKFFLSERAIAKLQKLKQSVTQQASVAGVNPLLILLYEKLTPNWIMMGEPDVVKTERLGESH